MDRIAVRHLTSAPQVRRSDDRMETKRFVDAVTSVMAESQSADGRLHLTGSLRQHGTEYTLEERLELGAVNGVRWTIPRIHRLRATAETQDAVRASIDRIVTIVGTPGDCDERHRMSIILDSIQPVAFGSIPD